ncbi:GH10805 [Drosophila grimshawi]|uniref:GH10805 n=1 Tax=Drosophila grimshawi TaxID=7222 RepID=B4JAZ9_DROGR|nr:GH10805 [Drosophila grimshawi]
MAERRRFRKLSELSNSDEANDPLEPQLEIRPTKIEQDISSDYESNDEVQPQYKRTRIEKDLPRKRKHKNRDQSNTLITFMEQNPEIAKGHVKGERFAFDAKWYTLVADLNADGPPCKSLWSEWKMKIRKKLFQMKKNAAGLESGCQSVFLTPDEESIAQLCGFYDNVEIVQCDKFFGCSKDNEKRKSHAESRNSSKVESNSPPSEEAMSELCGFYESGDDAEHKTNIKMPKQSSTNYNADKFADFDPDIFARNRKRPREAECLQEFCSTQNDLMTRVADTLDAIRCNMAEQTSVMQQHFKRMEEIELRKLEAMKSFRK